MRISDWSSDVCSSDLVDAFWDDDSGLPLVLDPLDLVTELSTMMSVFAAQRFERVAAMHREALTEVTTFSGASLEIIERSLRLDLAAALHLQEHADVRLLLTRQGRGARSPHMYHPRGGASPSAAHHT